MKHHVVAQGYYRGATEILQGGHSDSIGRLTNNQLKASFPPPGVKTDVPSEADTLYGQGRLVEMY